jgi:hypothetical protein
MDPWRSAAPVLHPGQVPPQPEDSEQEEGQMHSPREITRVVTMCERAEPWGWDRDRGAVVGIVSPTTMAGVFGDSEDGDPSLALS